MRREEMLVINTDSKDERIAEHQDPAAVGGLRHSELPAAQAEGIDLNNSLVWAAVVDTAFHLSTMKPTFGLIVDPQVTICTRYLPHRRRVKADGARKELNNNENHQRT